MFEHREYYGHHGRRCGGKEERQFRGGPQEGHGRGRPHRPHHGPFGPAGPEMRAGFGHEVRFHRHFMTRAECIEKLEAHLHDLQNEAKAVEERIASIKAEAG